MTQIVLYCIHPFLQRFSQHEPFRSAPDHSNRHSVSESTLAVCYKQLQVKNLSKVLTWQLERDSNPWPSGRKASTLSICQHAPQWYLTISDRIRMHYVVSLLT